jgi:hypothetical protein
MRRMKQLLCCLIHSFQFDEKKLKISNNILSSSFMFKEKKLLLFLVFLFRSRKAAEGDAKIHLNV